MKRIKLIASIVTLSIALVICCGGIIGFLAALNATYNINGTVSYTANHVNATIKFEKFESAITETLERTSYDIEHANYKSQPQQTATVSFSDTTSATETKATDADFSFSTEIVAYKVKLTIKNNGSFNINIYTTAQESDEQDNWFIKIISTTDCDSLEKDASANVFVYVGIKDLTKNVSTTNFNIQTALEKVSFVELSYEINNQIVHTQQVQKNTKTNLLSVYDTVFEEDIENGNYGQTNKLQRTYGNEKQGVGAWLDGQDKVVDEDTVITSNMLLKPDWWFYDNSCDETGSAWNYISSNDNYLYPSLTTKTKSKILVPQFSDFGNFSLNGFGSAAIENIIIPEGIKALMGGTFSGATNLKTVKILDAELSLWGDAQFYGCTSLIKINLPQGVTDIPAWAFQNCTSLKNITLPDSLISITKYAFAGCTSLESVVIPDGVLSIGSHAFADCTSLKRISIPSNTMSFGAAIFAGCTSLVKDGFVLGSGMSTDGKALFKTSSNIKTLISFFSNDASYQVPQGVHHIGRMAFMENNNLVSVTIPESVIFIAPMAFAVCPYLNTVIIKGVPLVGFAAFFESPVNNAYINSQPAAEWHAWFESTYGFTTVQAVSQILAIYQEEGVYMQYSINVPWDVIGWPNPGDELITDAIQEIVQDFPNITGIWLPFDKLFIAFEKETNFYFLDATVKLVYENSTFWDEISNRFYLQ